MVACYALELNRSSTLTLYLLQLLQQIMEMDFGDQIAVKTVSRFIGGDLADKARIGNQRDGCQQIEHPAVPRRL